MCPWALTHLLPRDEVGKKLRVRAAALLLVITSSDVQHVHLEFPPDATFKNFDIYFTCMSDDIILDEWRISHRNVPRNTSSRKWVGDLRVGLTGETHVVPLLHIPCAPRGCLQSLVEDWAYEQQCGASAALVEAPEVLSIQLLRCRAADVRGPRKPDSGSLNLLMMILNRLNTICAQEFTTSVTAVKWDITELLVMATK